MNKICTKCGNEQASVLHCQGVNRYCWDCLHGVEPKSTSRSSVLGTISTSEIDNITNAINVLTDVRTRLQGLL
jgi:hypothetical protein